MSIKNFTVNDSQCYSSTHPCKHYGIIETLDGSRYEGLICSSISKAIISNISLKCLQILPEQIQATGSTSTNHRRTLKFLAHIHLHQYYKDQPLAYALKELNFIKKNETTFLTGAKLEELKQAISKVTQFGYSRLINSNFEHAPDLYDQLNSVTQNIYEFVDRYPAREEEIREVTPYLSEAELLLYNLSTGYNEQVYKTHTVKLNKKSRKIKEILEKPSLPAGDLIPLQKKLERMISICKAPPKTHSKIPVTASDSLQLELSKAEQNAYSIWLQGYERVKWIQSLQKIQSEKTDEKREKTLEQIEKTLEQIEKTPEKTLEQIEKTLKQIEMTPEQTCEQQTHQQTTPEEFICPISQDIMTDPVITPQGISFEKSAIVNWLSQNSTCPITREPLQAKQLVPNRSLKDLIDKWQAQ